MLGDKGNEFLVASIQSAKCRLFTLEIGECFGADKCRMMLTTDSKVVQKKFESTYDTRIKIYLGRNIESSFLSSFSAAAGSAHFLTLSRNRSGRRASPSGKFLTSRIIRLTRIDENIRV